jgi:hypothetical protein
VSENLYKFKKKFKQNDLNYVKDLDTESLDSYLINYYKREEFYKDILNKSYQEIIAERNLRMNTELHRIPNSMLIFKERYSFQR